MFESEKIRALAEKFFSRPKEDGGAGSKERKNVVPEMQAVEYKNKIEDPERKPVQEIPKMDDVEKAA